MNEDAITIRHSTHADQSAILRLAALDDRVAPHGEALLAYVDGELRAALPLDGGQLVSDPFHLTQEIVDLLLFRAEQELDGRSERIRGSGRLRPRRLARTAEVAA
jgi:hypothetical protein